MTMLATIHAMKCHSDGLGIQYPLWPDNFPSIHAMHVHDRAADFIVTLFQDGVYTN